MCVIQCISCQWALIDADVVARVVARVQYISMLVMSRLMVHHFGIPDLEVLLCCMSSLKDLLKIVKVYDCSR